MIFCRYFRYGEIVAFKSGFTVHVKMREGWSGGRSGGRGGTEGRVEGMTTYMAQRGVHCSSGRRHLAQQVHAGCRIPELLCPPSSNNQAGQLCSDTSRAKKRARLPHRGPQLQNQISCVTFYRKTGNFYTGKSRILIG